MAMKIAIKYFDDDKGSSVICDNDYNEEVILSEDSIPCSVKLDLRLSR